MEASAKVANIGLMTHLANADERHSPFHDAQLNRFHRQTHSLKGPKSLARSAAIIASSETHGDWVRPGIMLYGASPFREHDPALDLQPVMTLRSTISAIRTVSAVESVGYGCTWVAEKDSRIATVTLGYADGYPRSLPSGTPVLIKGRECPLVGRVSMDLISVDVSDCPEAVVGSDVILWGQDLSANRIAQMANTIPYELFTGISSRVPRIIESSR